MCDSSDRCSMNVLVGSRVLPVRFKLLDHRDIELVIRTLCVYVCFKTIVLHPVRALDA